MVTKQRTVMAVTLGLICLSFATAQARQVDVTIDLSNGPQIAQDLNLDLSHFEELIANRVAQYLGVVQSQNFLRALADSQSFASNGLGVDYSGRMSTALLGVGTTTTLRLSNESVGGLGNGQLIRRMVNTVSVMAGGNLGFIGQERISLFGNFFQTTTKSDALQTHLTNYGLHAQLKSIGARGLHVGDIAWGGVDVTVGLAYSKLVMSIPGQIEARFPLVSEPIKLGVVFAGTGRLRLESTTLRLPFEISSGFQMGRWLSLFGGGGIDMQLGSNSLNILLNSTLDVEDASGNRLRLADIYIEARDDTRPNLGKFRVFGGAQFNVSALSLFAQVNYLPPRATTLTFGTRVSW